MFIVASHLLRRSAALLAMSFLPAGLWAHAAPANSPAQHSVWYTLGTNGGPIARPTRSEPAHLLVYGDRHILVDCGDGAAEQLAKVGVPLGQIDTILLSHMHFDHMGGLFGLLGMRYQILTTTTITVYGPPGTKRLVDSLIAAMQVEAESGRGFPNAPHLAPPQDTIRVVEIGDGDQFKVGSVSITARRNTHYSYPEDSEDAKRFQSLAFRFDLPDRSIAYTGDTGPSPAVEELAKGVDILFSEVQGDPSEIVAELRRTSPGLPEPVYQQVIRHMKEQHLSAEPLGLLAKNANVKTLVLVHNNLSNEEAAKAIAAIAVNFKGKVIESHDLDKF